MMRVRLLLLAVCLGLALCYAVVRPTREGYDAICLVVANSTILIPSDMNERGQVVGELGCGEATLPFIWDDARGLRPLSSPALMRVKAVNAVGVAVGSNATSIEGNLDRLVVWDGYSSVSPIVQPAWPGDIDRHGRVVGSMIRNGRWTAYLWEPRGRLTLIDTPQGKWSHALAINDAGVVAGAAQGEGNTRTVPFVWDREQGYRALSAPAVAAEPVAINDRRECAGYVTSRGGGSQACLWDASGRAFGLGGLGGVCSFASALNNRGQVLGTAETAEHHNHAFVWDTARGMCDLNRLVRLPGITLTEAVAITDRGWILAAAEDGERCFAVVLRPRRPASARRAEHRDPPPRL